jgi:LmbE family N-acetylglucosaminyl deacetylase
MLLATAPLWLAVVFTAAGISAARPSRQPGAAELARAIERLSVLGHVLYVAAHPDDENTRLLAYLSGEKLVRAQYLSLTRGDGGQNLIGPQQGPLLGLIRTQELLAARAIDGAEQRFTRARDFGYSKNPEETLRIWDRAAVLSDVVLALRRFRPDVVITRFPSHGGDTHGHHTASAILAEEAFRAAADPGFQVSEKLPAWQAKRIVWNRTLWNAKDGEDLSAFLKLDVGGFNPAVGLSYGEIAALSRSMHKSQGFGAAPTRGHSYEYFLPVAGERAQANLFDGIDLSWRRVPGGDKVAEKLSHARAEFKPERPDAVIPALLQARAAMAALADSPWKREKLYDLDDVIAWSAGLWLDATASEGHAVPGGSLPVTVTALNRSAAPLTLESLDLPGGVHIAVGKPLPREEPRSIELALVVPADARLSSPSWLSEPPEPGLFKVEEPALIGLPEDPPALQAVLTVAIAGHPLRFARPIRYRFVDPVAGERERAVEILPAVVVNPERNLLLFPDAKPRTLRVSVSAFAPGARGVVRPELPPGWRVDPAERRFELTEPGETAASFEITPPAGQAAEATLRVQMQAFGKTFDRGLVRVAPPHIPQQTVLPKAEVKLCRFELLRGRRRIGYVPGAGDEVAPALAQAGYEVTILDDDTLATRPLAGYDAIVLGVRAFNTDPRLQKLHDRLMAYVAAGGTLVAQYNTSNRIAKAPQKLGPYPFEISQDRVTDETAAVRLAIAHHPVLSHPNRIAPADFNGWIQERGLYFAGTWDPRYETPLEMNDPGEPTRKGALLVARHGKGAFVYTGLAFFRQLPAGVPGAFRLFANLIAYGH